MNLLLVKKVNVYFLLGMFLPFTVIAQLDSVELKQVEVVGKKKEQAPTQSTVELSGKDLDHSRGLSLGEMLQKIAGVNVVQTGPTIFKPVIQGMYGQRVLIMNNGVRQEGQQWGSEHAPEVDPFVASKITVVKGASSVRYGSDAIGGVVLVESRPLRKEAGLGGEVNLGAFSNNRSGVGSVILDYSPTKLSGLSGRLQGTFRRGGNSKTPDYYLKNTAFGEYNFSYALGYLKRKAGVEIFYSQFNTKLGIFSASHIGNLTDLERAIASPVPLESSGFSYAIARPYQQVSHELFKVSTYLKTGSGNKWAATYALQYNDRREYDKHKSLNDSIAALDNPELELHIITHTANLTFEHSLVRNIKGTIGATGIAQGNIYKGRFFIPNFKSYAGGIFLIEEWEKNRWTVEAGIRYDYKWLQVYYYKQNVYQDPQFNFANFSGSLGASYLASRHVKVRSNVGTAFRPPHVSELFSNGLHHGAASVEVGDQNLKSERAYNFSGSVRLQYSRLSGEASVYYTRIQDYIYLAPVFPATLTIRGAFPAFQYKQVDADFAGVDAWLSDSLSKNFTITSKASILYAYNATVKERLIFTPPTRVENGLLWHFRLGRKVAHPFLGLSNTIVFRKQSLPDSSDYAPAPRGYTLFNAQAGFSIPFGKTSLDIAFACNNMFNEKYRDYLDRFRYYANAIGRNFSVRLKLIF